MISFSRRTFLRRGSVAALTPALHRPVTDIASWLTQSAGPSIRFPGQPHERISVSSYPFRAFISGQHDNKSSPSSKMPLKDFAAHVAAKFNIRKIEPWSEHFLSLEPGQLDDIRDAAGKTGSSFVNIAADGDNSIYSADAAERQRAVQFGRTWIDVAARIGSPSMRLNIAAVKGVQPDVKRVAEGLKPIAEYAASKNIAVHLENDNPVSENPFFVVSVLDRMSNPWLHALPDFGNSFAVLPGEDVYRALGQMFAHAYAISHVKDATTSPANVVVPVDLARIFALAKKHNYKGMFSMEFESAGDPYAGTSKLIAATIKILS